MLFIVSGSGHDGYHTSFLLKTSTHTYTHWQKAMYPCAACLSENQWSVRWVPLSVVMKLRGHLSTQTTNLTWPQLTRSWQRRQPEQREQSQSNWVTTNTPKTNRSLLFFYVLFYTVATPFYFSCIFFIFLLLLFSFRLILLKPPVHFQIITSSLCPTCLHPILSVCPHIATCKSSIKHG